MDAEEALFRLTLEPSPDGVARARPFGTGAETVFESGTGRAEGRALTGSLRYSRRIERRASGIATVVFHALVTAADGAQVALEGEGREDAAGDGLAVMGWNAQADGYRALNAAVLRAEVRPGALTVFGRGSEDGEPRGGVTGS